MFLLNGASLGHLYTVFLLIPLFGEMSCGIYIVSFWTVTLIFFQPVLQCVLSQYQ